MKKKDRGMPEIVFHALGRNKQPFKLTVFIIHERDAEGIPRKLEMLLDNESVEIQEGSDFMTGYVPEHMTKPNDYRTGGKKV